MNQETFFSEFITILSCFKILEKCEHYQVTESDLKRNLCRKKSDELNLLYSWFKFTFHDEKEFTNLRKGEFRNALKIAKQVKVKTSEKFNNVKECHDKTSTAICQSIIASSLKIHSNLKNTPKNVWWRDNLETCEKLLKFDIYSKRPSNNISWLLHFLFRIRNMINFLPQENILVLVPRINKLAQRWQIYDIYLEMWEKLLVSDNRVVRLLSIKFPMDLLKIITSYDNLDPSEEIIISRILDH